MKNIVLKYVLILAAVTVVMGSCGQMEEELNSNNEEVNSEVFSYRFGQQIVDGSQQLRLLISELKGDSLFLTKKAVLIYYTFEGDSVGNWHSALNPDPNKDYRLHFSFGESVDSDTYELRIEALDAQSAEDYGRPLNFSDIRILAPLHSSLRSLTKSDLDLADYYAVTKYFGLEE
ncbi:hypothetical protein [Parapedobacter sp. DT-150]|uniref:hypothetical protein n=1 Tax=Parapedobacter sp. DT-150 TaxID=3396162 RepID=UPI003F1954C2